MLNWSEVIGFIRGTRPRPPPGPAQPLVTVLLVAASLLHLPLVYLLVRDIDLQPAFTLIVGLLAMGLAWSSGVSLEGRRLGTVRVICAVGIGEGALAFVPILVGALGDARWLFLASAVGCAAALARLLLAAPSRSPSP